MYVNPLVKIYFIGFKSFLNIKPTNFSIKRVLHVAVIGLKTGFELLTIFTRLINDTINTLRRLLFYSFLPFFIKFSGLAMVSSTQPVVKFIIIGYAFSWFDKNNLTTKFFPMCFKIFNRIPRNVIRSESGIKKTQPFSSSKLTIFYSAPTWGIITDKLRKLLHLQ